MKAILFNKLIYRKTVLLFLLSLFYSALLFAQPGNDNCSGATSVTSNTSCIISTKTLNSATASAGIPVGCASGGTHYDVWYKFTAVNIVHTVTISNRGTNFTNPELQIFSGACASLTSLACGTTTVTASGLTIGTVYYIRVSNVGTAVASNGAFDICVTHVAIPATDNCSGATSLTSNTTCTISTKSLNGATASTGIPAGCASGGVHYDIWFRFTALNITHTVTISNLGSNFTNPELQVFSGSCGTLTSLACGTTSVTATGLVIGNIYYIRVSNIGSPISTNGNFDICVTHPVPAPANDECSGAISLTSGTSCSNTTSSLSASTASSGIPVGCSSAGVHYDVWYSFTAARTKHTVTISSLGTNFTNPEIQVFSGTCGSLTSLGCGTTTVTLTGLTIGNTYYVRVSNIGTPVTSNGGFNICITHPPAVPVNDDCSGATTLTSASACNSITSNLYYATSETPAGSCGGATATTTYSLWFKFQATATTQTVTLSNLGSQLSAATTYIEMFSGTCGSLTALGCQTAATRQTISGLTIGTFYYVRIYILLSPTATPSSGWNFDICVQQPPVNDECAGAITLTSGATCSNTAGTLDLATANAATPLGCFAAGTYYDVWYKFVATAVTHTVTLSGMGMNFTAPRIQIYSGNCGALVSMGCALTPFTSLTQNLLVPGTTYYVRIANLTTNPSGTGSVANFNICVTAVSTVPPANDLCSGAITLISSTNCSNISGTLINATADATLPACGNNGSSEVWYKFVAQSAYPTITLSTIGANLTAASPRIQLFTGACGTLTQVTGACTTNPLSVLALGGAGLTIGTTYYVRITTNTSMAPPTSGTWTFNICVTDPVIASIDYGKSYVNITDGTIGGNIDVGDVLEIRSTLVISAKTIDSLAYYDTLRAGKGFKFVPGSIALKTNEGKLYKSYTDAHDITDAGWYTTAGAGTDTTIQINMGTNATYAARSTLTNTSKPSNFGSTCIIMATFRVTVNAAYGTAINFGGGAFKYRDVSNGVFYTISFPRDSLMVYQSPGACPNNVAPTNIIGDEFNGTFGVPTGSAPYPQNRGTSPNTNYIYKTFTAGTPNDYYYGVANNTSAAGTTVQTVAKPNAARVFNLWDITGDHTGAATAKGNKPCNLGLPISATNPCGYMLVINSAYHTDVAFQFNVTGSCPETYYEISAWFKNICYKCGCDSNGKSSTTAGYIPTAPGDSAGIRPNIAFAINGIDYYTTGDILYQGLGGTQTGSDTLNTWVKRSFVYKTGPAENSFLMTFRNNAPGGGGNDWALDDISLRTCYPGMTYSPSNNPSACQGNPYTIYDTVRSFYNTYIYYKWQRSTNGGATWVDLAGASGVAVPVWNGTSYQYVVSYTIPPAATTPGNSGDLYRVVVATTASNLASSTCFSTDVTPITLTVLTNCVVLRTEFLTVSGVLENNNYAKIRWQTSKEDEPVNYELQKSTDGILFNPIALINGYNNPALDFNLYNYVDSFVVSKKVYYRVVMSNFAGAKKYSSIIQLESTSKGFTVLHVINPFTDQLHFDISSQLKADVHIALIDQFGRTMFKQNYTVYQGINSMTVNNTEKFSAGIYFLKVESYDGIYTQKVMKIQK